MSRPLVGDWEHVKIEPAVLVEGAAKRKLAEGRSTEPTVARAPKKKQITSFHDLLNHFPAIARQLQPGLEKLFREFTTAFDRPLPPPPSANEIPDPLPDGPIVTAMKRARTSSVGRLPVTENFYAADDEDVMRASLESAVTTVIDQFQSVDKHQLSVLGATTDLTGPVVEKLIERYVAENVHQLLFPKISALKKSVDQELESKIKRMEYIDVSQLGIHIRGGSKGKHGLTIQLGLAVEEFRTMSSAMGPQEMLDLLLSTMKKVSQLTEVADGDTEAEEVGQEKTVMTVNADTLVSLLLFVVIRAQVRHLQARLTYIRNFIFVEDVDNGEMGYALSTFEAVLAYLMLDSAGLRRASRRNKGLWDAASNGDVSVLRALMDPSCSIADDGGDEDEDEDEDEANPLFGFDPAPGQRHSRRSSLAPTLEGYSHGSGLGHVFPFQSDSPDRAPPKRVKKVALDTRSMSSGSERSFHSRTSLGTVGSALEGDVTVERLAQTSNSFGESVLMMAVQGGNNEALKYLLSLTEYFPPDVVLSDVNDEETTLLSAAVQLGNAAVIDTMGDYVVARASTDQILGYCAAQDIWGRSLAHYLFHAPALIPRIGKLVPWRQRDKNGQTPLFALCRSYDHGDYYGMVAAGLDAARRAQGDGMPLHVDDHVDAKGNTLLHIVRDARLALGILLSCDVDVNATNDKRFTPLMVASKYARYEMVRCLFGDGRVDVAAKDLRGLTAVELAKDENMRTSIDDLVLFGMPAAADGRITGVVRAYFVEDATIRMVLKTAEPANDGTGSYTMTTTRRSLADFEHLCNLLALENPASWLPAVAGLRTPFQMPSKPSRAMLRDIQMRADWFVKMMVVHPTFGTHEMVWEFLLVPELQPDMMAQRSRLKAETRAEKVREEMEPVADVREVEQFVDHARDMVRSVNYATKSVARRVNAVAVSAADLHDATGVFHRALSTLEFLPRAHVAAFEMYLGTLEPAQPSPATILHSSHISSQSTIQALLTSLSRPASLAVQITAARKLVDRESASGPKSRWPLGLLDDVTRQKMASEKEERTRRGREEVDDLGRELRYTQQVVAGELAGWGDLHGGMGRRALREYARGVLGVERGRLEGLGRALRRVRGGGGGVG